MLSVAISSLDLTFSKLLEYTSPNDLERTNCRLVADSVRAKLLEHSIRDLARCLNFHSIDFDEDLPNELYVTTKIKPLRERIEKITATEHAVGPK
jgi:hypothetical protein